MQRRRQTGRKDGQINEWIDGGRKREGSKEGRMDRRKSKRTNKYKKVKKGWFRGQTDRYFIRHRIHKAKSQMDGWKGGGMTDDCMDKR